MAFGESCAADRGAPCARVRRKLGRNRRDPLGYRAGWTQQQWTRDLVERHCHVWRARYRRTAWRGDGTLTRLCIAGGVCDCARRPWVLACHAHGGGSDRAWRAHVVSQRVLSRAAARHGPRAGIGGILGGRHLHHAFLCRPSLAPPSAFAHRVPPPLRRLRRLVFEPPPPVRWLSAEATCA